MKSHEYAAKLKQAAEFLLSKDDVELDSGPRVFVPMSGGGKENFLAAVRAFGAGKKDFDFPLSAFPYMYFTPTGQIITLSINRDAVCRKVQDVKWECEPLLSQDEMDAIGAEQSQEIPF